MKSDARLKKIVLTDKAKEFSINIEREFACTEAKIVEGISEEEMRAFSATLDKIKANMLGLLEK
jgi:DNA-binding MarR family transcriptional regulator